MGRQTLKNHRFEIIGYIDDESGGKQKALNSRFEPVGYYDPRTNRTTDARYQPVGTGNLLASLIGR